ncbi:MAG TPA: phage tail tube protein [Caulobacteraceae bacterium]|jgi:hypothetical protein|nr:phage tail tube protein [Caulobacteraceae bacterium]
MSDLIAGTATLTINGQPYALRGNFKYRVSGVHREGVWGQDGYHGNKEKKAPGQMGGDITDLGGLSVSQLSNVVGASLVAILANGKTVVGTNLSRSGDPLEAETEDAKITIMFEGPSVVDYST